MAKLADQIEAFARSQRLWTVLAWASSVCVVVGAAVSGHRLAYSASFALLVMGWVIYGAGWPLPLRHKLALLPVFIWTLLLPVWVALAMQLVNALADRKIIPSSFLSDYKTVVIVNACVLCTISATLAGLATLSRRTTLLCASGGMLSLSGLIDKEWIQWTTGIAWHSMVFGAVALWAFRARVKRRSGHYCRGCGYDVRGIQGAVCPECGTECVREA